MIWVVAATAVLYAPLAATYMWFAFDPDAPRLQDALASVIDGRAYASGVGSVRAVRTIDYVDHRVVMVMHTTLGAVALLLGMLQYSGAIRRRRRVHRRIGRLYLALMSASMLTAITFLARTSAVRYPGQSAFRLQLWVLAASTLGSGWIAFAAIRRGNRRAHRAWMALNTSFMMTAPLLRVSWTALAPVFPDRALLTNLGVSAVVLAVVAPAAGAVAALLTDSRRSRPGDAGATWVQNGVLAAVAVAGAGSLTVRSMALTGHATAAGYPWFHTIPVLADVAACATGAVRAKVAGDVGRERQWRTLMAGASLASWSALVVGLIASVPYGPVEGYIAGLMVGPGAPIITTFALVVFTAETGGPSSRRPHAESPREGPGRPVTRL